MAALWAIAISGLDEIIAFPDQATAERAAAHFNADPLLKLLAAERAGRWIASPRVFTARAMPWSEDAASHAEHLARGTWKRYLPKESRP